MQVRFSGPVHQVVAVPFFALICWNINAWFLLREQFARFVRWFMI